MIVVDTSALVAIALGEAPAARCRRALMEADAVLISAATLVEARIVASRRRFRDELEGLLTAFRTEVISVDADAAWITAEAYRRYGKGFHPARLNFGDCFSYELAQSRGCPLLYVGDDFAQIDVRPAITAAP